MNDMDYWIIIIIIIIRSRLILIIHLTMSYKRIAQLQNKFHGWL